jgi:hypothetical protein
MNVARPERVLHDLFVAIVSLLAIVAVVAAGLLWLAAHG